MIIEFWGLPGSGKTFISKALVKDKGFVIATRKKITIKKRFTCIINKIRYRVFWSFFLKILVSRANLLEGLKRFYGLILLDSYINESNKISIYDQHLIQYLISFYMVTGIEPNYKDIKDLTKYYRMPTSSIIVYIDLDVDFVCKRFNQRKNSLEHNKTLLDNLNNYELFDYMYKLKALNEVMLEIMKPLKLKIIHWQSSGSYNVQILINKLEEEVKLSKRKVNDDK